MMVGWMIPLLCCSTRSPCMKNKIQISSLNFALGLAVGLVFAFLSFSSISQVALPVSHRRFSLSEKSHEDLDKILENVRPVVFEDTLSHHDDDSVAKSLFDKVRILCWVMTSPSNLDKKAVHVKTTWAKRCNKVIFMSSVTNHTFPTIGLNVSEGREHLTGKSMQAFRYVYDHYFDEADWFMKADDDTYVILENLRYFLSGQSSKDPIFFGHHFKTHVRQGYFSGGAGYILSKEALRRLYVNGTDPANCRQDGGAEDVAIGHCMEILGVKAGNSTDALGRSRFHCFGPETHVNGGYPNWYYNYDANGAKKGMDSVSDYAISFHYVSPQKMYALEFLVYHLRPFGIQSGNQELNQRQNNNK